MKHSAGFEQLVAEVKPRIQEITCQEVLAKQNSGEPFHFIDVREDHEWDKGRAAGSVHIGRGILERDIEQAIPDMDAVIVLYCGGGYRSALSADNLQRMGYRRVFSMAGGIRAWRESGLPEDK